MIGVGDDSGRAQVVRMHRIGRAIAHGGDGLVEKPHGFLNRLAEGIVFADQLALFIIGEVEPYTTPNCLAAIPEA